MAKYPQKYLEIPQFPVAVIAIDTVGHLPVMSEENRLDIAAICLHASYVQ